MSIYIIYWVRSFILGDSAAPTVAFFVDDVADPIEAFTILNHLAKLKFNIHLISHSQAEHERGDASEGASLRRVKTETVWGNAMYALKDCCCELLTLPANLVDASLRFDGFFVAGGQCPYYMMKDPAIEAIMDATPIAAAVCHGPEALIGTKWLHPFLQEKLGNLCPIMVPGWVSVMFFMPMKGRSLERFVKMPQVDSSPAMHPTQLRPWWLEHVKPFWKSEVISDVLIGPKEVGKKGWLQSHMLKWSQLVIYSSLLSDICIYIYILYNIYI